jgi:hypothetical protein
VQNRRPTAKQAQHEYRGGELGLLRLGCFAKGLLDPQMCRCHARAIDPSRDLADEAERCVFIQRLRECRECSSGFRRGVTRPGVQPLSAFPIGVRGWAAYGLE